MVIQENQKEILDEIAITKAAAWAWYERGSWLEQKSVRETDCIRTRMYTPRPSRYKLEAMKIQQKENLRSQTSSNVSNPLLDSEQFDKSLLDMYEKERISRDLDCYLECSRVEDHSKLVDDGGKTIASQGRESKRRGKKMHARFWMRHGIMCGSSRDSVVEHALLTGGQHQQRDNVGPSPSELRISNYIQVVVDSNGGCS